MLVGGFRKQVGGLVRNRLVAGFAETEKDIKMRMKSVSSTIKITKAMKMVATAKMKAEVDRMENGKNFGVHFVSTMFKNDEYMTKRVGDFEPRRTLLVPITSDRGLCGAVNANIVRETRDFLKSRDHSKFNLLIVGDKGTAGLTRNFSELVVGSLNELAMPMNFYVRILAYLECLRYG